MNNAQIIILFAIVAAFFLAFAGGIMVARYTFHKMHTRATKNFTFKTLFHKEAHPFGEHGTIYVDCPAKGWRGEPISFVFEDVPTSPQMSLDLLMKLWADAELAGYIPIALRTYNQIHAAVKPARSAYVAKDAQEAAIHASNERRNMKHRHEQAAIVDQEIYSAQTTPQTKSA